GARRAPGGRGRPPPRARGPRGLGEGGQADPELLAVHFRDGGDARKAARYTARAADRAQEALAFARAARLYAEAIALVGDEAARVRPLRRKLGDALANAGRGGE